MKRSIKHTASLGLMSMLLATASFAQDCPIKVGVLNSTSGDMAKLEAPLKGALELMVSMRNENGGLLGCELEVLSADPGSKADEYGVKAREMMADNGASVLFGASTGKARKAIVPVLEELNGLLIYPGEFAGQESSRNVFYTGGVPNQQAIPAADYMMDELEVEKFYLIGTDYDYPHITNAVLKGYLMSKGVAEENIIEKYTPPNFFFWRRVVDEVVDASESGDLVGVISTISGAANKGFYQLLASRGIESSDLPVVTLSVGEPELSDLTIENLAGHWAVFNYFQSAETPENEEWVTAWKNASGAESVSYNGMEALYIGFNLWANAVEQAGSTETDAVRSAMYGQETANLTGGMAVMQPNHLVSKPALIGEIDVDGQFYIVGETEVVEGDAWSDYVPASVKLKADWAELNCGKYDAEASACIE